MKMLGRASQLDQNTAISQLEEMAHRADPVRSHVGELIASQAFRGSRRSCDFLEYVVEKALAGDFDLLKERMLGVELFGRDPAYDTSGDAIVRVTASDVRKRLAKFYAGIKIGPDIRIDLPPGSYIVQFQFAPAPSILPSRAKVIETMPIDLEASPALRPSLPWRLATGLFAAVVALVCAWIAIHPLRTGSTTNSYLPWSAMRRNNRPLKFVFSDPNIASFQKLFGIRLSLADYASRHYLPEGHPLSPESARVLSVLRGNTVPSVDAATAVRVSGIVRSSLIQTVRARTLQSGDFKTEDNFILMGSPVSNPWVSLFRDLLDFEFTYDSDKHEEVIRNKRPAPGEAAIYTPTVPGWGTGQAYAIAAFFANPNQSGHIMILAGSNAAATEAAGKFVTNPELVAATLKAHGLKPDDQNLQFEILLRVTTIATSLNTFYSIGCHRLSAAAHLESSPRDGMKNVADLN
jgi:hypothetical protein